MTKLTTASQEMIASFAKANKVSKAKVSDLIKSVMTEEYTPRGRTASEKIKAVRDVIVREFVGKELRFSSKDVVKKCGVTMYEANNALHFLEKNEQITRGGKITATGKGRKAIEWVSAKTL